MGAGASIEQDDEAKQREQCDALYDEFNKLKGGVGAESLNYMELKKGFEELKDGPAHLELKISAKKFYDASDVNDDKQIDKEEFFTMMKKVLNKGDLVQIEQTKETDDAATKLQAIQRGKKDRAAVVEKKEQNGAATKLQAIQRGNTIRKGDKKNIGAHADLGGRITDVFNALDYKDTGALELEELRIELGAEAESIMADMDGKFDKTKDNKIQLEEWQKFFLDLEPVGKDDVATGMITMLEGLIAGRSAEKEAAITKLQAMQRGRKGRAVVEEKKEVIEQNGAATKLQAIQRGNDARKAAADTETKSGEPAAA